MPLQKIPRKQQEELADRINAWDAMTYAEKAERIQNWKLHPTGEIETPLPLYYSVGPGNPFIRRFDRDRVLTLQ